MEILDVNDVRVFRPIEVTKLINAIPKLDNKTKFEVLLYTGARYSEIKAFYENPRWFNGVSINMPNTKKLVRKKSRKRNIRLNPQGIRAVNEFLYRCDSGLPHYTNWYNDLKRWCRYAEIGDECVSIKSTRKTWESWLVTTYEQNILHILSSMGHTQTTALRHYLNLGFDEGDKQEINQYTKGWM